MSDVTSWLDQSHFHGFCWYRAAELQATRTVDDLPARKKTPTSQSQILFMGRIRGARQDKKKERQLWLFASLHLCLSLNQEHTDGCHAPSKLHRRTPTDGLTRSGPFLILRALHGQIHTLHLDSRHSSYSSCINHGVLLLCRHVSPNLWDVWLLDFLQVRFFFYTSTYFRRK